MSPEPETIYQKVMLPSSPKIVFEVLTDPARLSELTGQAVEGRAEPGGCMTIGGDSIRFLELEDGKWLAFEWTACGWPQGAPPSRVEIGLRAIGQGTDLRLSHTGAPPQLKDEIGQHWYDTFWNPMFELLRSRPLY